MAIAPWAGAQALIGGPLPAWIPTIAGGAQVLLLVPVLAVALNHYLTVKGSHKLVELSPSLRFTFFGSIGYVVTSVSAAVLCSADPVPLHRLRFHPGCGGLLPVSTCSSP